MNNFMFFDYREGNQVWLASCVRSLDWFEQDEQAILLTGGEVPEGDGWLSLSDEEYDGQYDE